MTGTGATFGIDEAPPALAEWFVRLAGRWRVERDGSDGSRFAGEASFRPDGDRAFLLEEQGELTLAGGEALPARRAWIWHLMANGDLEIRYPQEAGGGLYHRFRPAGAAGGWTGEAEHLCGQDVYRADYRLGADEFLIAHEVRGPAKNYRLHARYRRT